MPRKEAQFRKTDTRVGRARELRRTMTDAERKLWWHLRGLRTKGAHFRRQATIGPFYVDFACHDRKLVVEVDGSGHMQPKQIASDATRTRFLESQGCRVLRFWNNDVLRETEAVVTVIYEALADTAGVVAPHP